MRHGTISRKECIVFKKTFSPKMDDQRLWSPIRHLRLEETLETFLACYEADVCLESVAEMAEEALKCGS